MGNFPTCTDSSFVHLEMYLLIFWPFKEESAMRKRFHFHHNQPLQTLSHPRFSLAWSVCSKKVLFQSKAPTLNSVGCFLHRLQCFGSSGKHRLDVGGVIHDMNHIRWFRSALSSASCYPNGDLKINPQTVSSFLAAEPLVWVHVYPHPQTNLPRKKL